MRKYQTKAFTLVELVVVITILAILGTIAFISFQGYSAQSRDSVRISDLSTTKTGLELFHIEAGKYPLTTGGFTVTYSGSTDVWTQGTLGEDTVKNIDKLDKKPIDPLTEKEYTYSITTNRQEYELAGLIEANEISLNNTIFQANAGDITAVAVVTGNYNGALFKTLSGTNCEVLAMPSIISSLSTTTTDLVQIVASGGLVYNGYNNLPTDYIGSKYNTKGGFNFNPTNIVAYRDNDSCNPLFNPDDNTYRKNLIEGLQAAYTGTIIAHHDEISNIMNIDTTDINQVAVDGVNLLNNSLGVNIVSNSEYVPYNCIANSSYQFNGHVYDIPNSFHSDNITITSNNVLENNGIFTYDLSLKCNDGNLEVQSEATASLVSCNNGFYYNGSGCSYQYTTSSGNANYSVSLPVDSSAHWYTVGVAKADGYIKFNISRRGDTYGYGGIYIDGKQAFFPREYGVISYDTTYFAGDIRFSNTWVETGVNTSNNGASGYADIWVNEGELIKVYGHRSNISITGNLQGTTGGYN